MLQLQKTWNEMMYFGWDVLVEEEAAVHPPHDFVDSLFHYLESLVGEHDGSEVRLSRMSSFYYDAALFL
jgi:hypothetical protein